MTRIVNRGWMPRVGVPVLVACGLISLAAVSNPLRAQEKAKTEAKEQKKPEAKEQKKPEAKEQKKPEAKEQKKPEAKPQAKDEKKPAAKAAAAPAAPPADDPAKLKQQVAALEKEVAALKLKVATLELEKLGAIVTVDKTKDGKEMATVNILKKWSGDKDALNLLKNVPNLQVVTVDNGQVNDAAVAP